ncbi:M23 family metallopeptidase [Fusibacter ferrireducens]|uniref:Peptidoglycan DD-metalloendopeptidase family protein n=1 Tax=Fusibacter ferrireducens TaxID=2785058 RepID=A0ABR9ZS54_9FIRM|nr:M23 family metallopeptidase [Fusibacter ferrireducens]MBF4693295.1 peptidoglycan DD-metalloendopeptidase family protein [Fusibacter ferrireducens]
MGKQKENRTYQKRVYKHTPQKYYIKGDRNIARKERVLEWLVRIIAMLFYPVYMLMVGFNKLVKYVKTKDWKSVLNIKGLNAQKKQNSNPYYKKSNSKSKKGTNKSTLSRKDLSFKFSGDKFKERISAFASKSLELFKTHKIIAISVLTGIVALAGGGYAWTHIHKTPTIDLATGEMHIVSVGNKTVSSEPLLEKPYIENLGFASLESYQIKANGNVLCNFKTEAEANQLLDDLKKMYTSNAAVEFLETYFSEEVEVDKGYVEITKFNGYDELESALAFIVKGTKEEKLHEVQKGENYWVIASYYGINPSDLEKANPNVKPETLQIGQKISLVVPRPLISVCTVEQAAYNTEMPFNVTYEETNSLYKEETKTKVKGVLGEKAVVAKITRQNGREIGRIIIEESVISEPVDKVVYKGTKDPPPKMGTGVLAKPTSRGVITSGFGWRWGRRHEGIDIGLPVGSDVKAADGGVVTLAAYSSSYGNYIIIDHGGNMSTLYAHNSKLLVKKGDKVYKGQVISKSGNTGRSTGPHLHFEVRKNGVPQDPTKYVNY